MGNTGLNLISRLAIVAVLAGAALVAPIAGVGSTQGAKALAASSAAFTNFEVAASPPHPVGTVCPSTQTPSPCDNYASEPAIRSAPNGVFYGSSEDGLGGGTDAWRSSDGGNHYKSLLRPDAASSANDTTFAPGGGDTDLATATALNASGHYNVYVASLSLANVDVSTSTDAGQTWTLNPTSATLSGDDREWIAAVGASKVCISYHDAATYNLDVNCSYNAGLTFTQFGSAIDPAHAWLLQNNGSGNLTIDPRNNITYQVFSGIGTAGDAVCSTTGTCNYHAVWAAVSTDGGKTFTDYPIYINPDLTASYNHQFVIVTTDRVGNVYAVYSDNHNVYYSYSTTHGTSWHGPYQVNSAPANTAIFPWVSARGNGHIDVVYYGTSYYDGVNSPDNYPASAAWYVYFAQNLSATTAGSAFTQTQASAIVHYGGVCESGVGCTGNRDLYDDFSVAASASTGLASIIYSDDQYSNTQAAPPATYGCTPANNNTPYCDHTMIATQTAGPAL